MTNEMSLDESRRIVLLLAAGEGVPVSGVEACAATELEHLRRGLGSGFVAGSVSAAPAVNPMRDTGSMMASSDFAAVVEIDWTDQLDDEVLLEALAGLGDRSGPTIDPQRSAVVVGCLYQRHDQAALVNDGHLKVVVALRGRPELSVSEFHRGWLEVGRLNWRNHPTCAAYAQLHADVELTARAMTRSGLAGGPFTAVARELFPAAADLHAGHVWAKSPGSSGGSTLGGAHLMDLLGRYLDFGSAQTLLAEAT